MAHYITGSPKQETQHTVIIGRNHDCGQEEVIAGTWDGERFMVIKISNKRNRVIKYVLERTHPTMRERLDFRRRRNNVTRTLKIKLYMHCH